ncbi:threonine--tRNA ligase [candidate division KSB1 bacterium]|nr:threonine--tRNA ligase [candidate division KSB1 bacterium]
MSEYIKIIFPDDTDREFAKRSTPSDIAEQISRKLSQQAIVAKFNDRMVDMNRPLDSDGRIVFYTADDPEGLDTYWHSTSHVMAHAIKKLFPEANFGFGPAIDHGFYYDVEVGRTLTPEDLEKIEKVMQEIIDSDKPFKRRVVTRDEAIELFSERNEKFKLEHIQTLEGELSVYGEGDFIDLCSGPHLVSTKQIKYFKLLNISGAYWKGDESNPMLQRIYGISFPKKSQLDDYLHKLEEARKRDHRRLGKELDLFSINETVGAGLILWHPNGALIRKLIEDFWKDEHLKAGYELVNTPHIARLNLWEVSGHLDFYSESMFKPNEMDNVQYQIKPMNCPFHLAIYKSRTRSYRELPIRWAELGTVYRYERSGVLHGLLRVRGFTQDDAHIFCRPDQLEDEILRCLNFNTYILKTFGFENYDVYLSTRPDNYVGTVENWDKATEALKSALEKLGLAYSIDPGEGVFYGPKIDIKIKDVLDRAWQCTTIQVDFNEPERFDITYRGQDGHDQRPIMVHRALMGSLERFFGVLIENYGGAFPVWLSPVQVILLPITDSHLEHAEILRERLVDSGIRVKLDDRSEKIGYKIRDAEMQKIPYMCIIGDKEIAEATISVRKRKEGDLGSFNVQDFIDRVTHEISTKQIT